MPLLDPKHLEAALILARAQRLVVFTGAGVSAESGVPTFRDAQTGLWAHYEPEQLASIRGFNRNPDLVWKFYMHRRDILKSCKPNAAHEALANWSKPGLRIITQNVDGFHQMAGSQDVIALHGDIRKNHCFGGCPGAISTEDLPEDDSVPPKCPQCRKAHLRPSVIWFGEMLDPAITATAIETVQQCDAMLMIGTSGLVYPAASLPELVLDAGKPLVEINPHFTPFSGRATVHLDEPAGQLLPNLIMLASRMPGAPATQR